ncbi:MAG: DUF2267 domain-containing protein [Actinomycetota bacterium]|nr:DUF2267 domain-containing protein [Actinomycetota bacterium]
MDALDALSTERPVLSTRTWRSPRPSVLTPTGTVEDARRLVAQLPMLVRGGYVPPTPLGAADAALRLEAAVWELAGRRDVPVLPGSTAAEVARALAVHGSVVPPAMEAVALLERLLAQGHPADELELCRVAARLTAYLELRARFG